MGTEGVIRGTSSDFRFSMKLPDDDQTHEGPQEGIYNGYFWMRTNPPQRISENNMHLSFVQDGDSFSIKGEGQNRLGPFDLIGTFDPKTLRMTCEKLYFFLVLSKLVIFLEKHLHIIQRYLVSLLRVRVKPYGLKVVLLLLPRL